MSDYTGFSSKVEEQSGHYLAIHVDTDVEGAVIQCGINNMSTLDEDGDIVLRVTDTTKPVKIKATAQDYDDANVELSIAGLNLMEETGFDTGADEVEVGDL